MIVYGIYTFYNSLLAATVSTIVVYNCYNRCFQFLLFVDPKISIIDKELLRRLSSMSVETVPFLQQLAWKLPFWQPLARLLGLSEVDVNEIEANYPVGQREDGSFLSPIKGEQAYQALLKWMQTKGHDATYGELLVALYNATLSNDNITDAWWYAYDELTCSKFTVR